MLAKFIRITAIFYKFKVSRASGAPPSGTPSGGVSSRVGGIYVLGTHSKIPVHATVIPPPLGTDLYATGYV